MLSSIPKQLFAQVAKRLSEASDTADLFDGFPYVRTSGNIDRTIAAAKGVLAMNRSLSTLTKHMEQDSERLPFLVQHLQAIHGALLDTRSLALSRRERFAEDMRIFASTLSEEDEKRYTSMMGSIFGPLLDLYIDHLMNAVEGRLTDGVAPHDNGSADANQATPFNKRRRCASVDSNDINDDSEQEEAAGAEAGPVPKRLNTGRRLASSDEDHVYLGELPPMDDDTQRLLDQARAEYPEVGPMVNAMLANPDLPTAPNSRATWGDVLKKYILPFASKRAFMTAAVLCLGVAVYRAHPEWVTILRESVSLPPQLRDMARSLPTPLTDMARNAASSLGLCEVAQDESMIQSLVTSPLEAGEVTQAEIIRSLEVITQEAQLDVDQVQHLIGFVKCEGSAIDTYNWYMDRQGSLSNSEFYSGLGTAVLCGAFTTLRIVKPLPA
ncbi:hypothetical protein K523DRAFT_148376 [Schizophyllum commune Tattone D]|nr:hypothetical protein K523DRAFT_148376 [Schizophyllum commune Tattone D]